MSRILGDFAYGNVELIATGWRSSSYIAPHRYEFSNRSVRLVGGSVYVRSGPPNRTARQPAISTKYHTRESQARLLCRSLSVDREVAWQTTESSAHEKSQPKQRSHSTRILAAEHGYLPKATQAVWLTRPGGVSLAGRPVR